MTTTTTAPELADRQQLRSVIASEWIRALTTRTTYALVIISFLVPALFTITQVMSVGHSGGADISTLAGIRQVLSAGSSAGLFATLIGILAVTSEFRHQTVALSLTCVPNRRRWFIAKLAATVPLGFLCTVFGQCAVLIVGIPLLAHKGVHPAIWHGDILKATVGTMILGGLTSAWGIGIGACIRNQTVAIAGTIIYTTLAEAAFLNYVPSVGRYLPGGATASMTFDPTVRDTVPALAGILLLACWAVSLLVIGYLHTSRGDVPADS